VLPNMHWLGDRDGVDITRHATDVKGCVMYFERQSDCLEFMRWVAALAVSSTHQSAPVQRAPHPSDERLPSGDAAGAGADTLAMPSPTHNSAFTVRQGETND